MTVTGDSPFRTLGDTTQIAFLAAISRPWSGSGRSPMAHTAGAVYDAVPPELRRLAVAMVWHETKNHSYPASLEAIPARTHNAWALTGSGDQGAHGRWAAFESYANAAKAWAARLLDPSGPYAKATTLRQFLTIYAPPGPPDYNDVDRYLDVVTKEVDALPPPPPPAPAPPGHPWTIKGTTRPIRLPHGLPLEIQLTPPGPNRSGRPMRPELTVFHETANHRDGADARMHARWQAGGTQGHPDGKIGVHFYVDDKVVIQTIPVDEQGVHAGDWRNGVGIAVEQCVNRDGDLGRALTNAEHLHAALLRDLLGTTAHQAMYPHHDRSGCPATINAAATWSLVETEVDRLIAAGPAPEPVPAFAGLPSWLPAAAFVAIFPPADPSAQGVVTKKLIEVLSTWDERDGIANALPWFVEKVDAARGLNIWKFTTLTILSQGARVWLPGEELEENA